MHHPLTAAHALIALTLAALPAAAAPCCDPASPFRQGEEMPAQNATCGTLPGWVDRAPQTDDRVSMAIEGRVTSAEADEVLAYLAMCEDAPVTVVCVTYLPLETAKGDRLVLAGGYNRAEPGLVVLDPCLPFAHDQAG